MIESMFFNFKLLRIVHIFHRESGNKMAQPAGVEPATT